VQTAQAVVQTAQSAARSMPAGTFAPSRGANVPAAILRATVGTFAALGAVEMFAALGAVETFAALGAVETFAALGAVETQTGPELSSEWAVVTDPPPPPAD
jgi:hypothetical protein